MVDKVIVSNDSALGAKYGTAGRARIATAVKALIAADAKSGLATQYVALDDAAQMKKLGAPAVKSAKNQRQNKAAIDGVFTALTPDYLMILGSVDVVPHQDLKNPTFNPAKPDDDEDETVPSDLPYACAAPFSTDVADFIAPNRVVGRLPDLTGAKDPKYLLDLLKTAAKPVTSKPAEIKAFGLSTDTWKKSTNLSLKKLLSKTSTSNVSPDKGPQWTTVQLQPRFHFINCHGAKNAAQFFGEPNDFPIAHDAAWITKKIAAGTVAAAECCYGAQLYDPKKAAGQMGIGSTYLSCGAGAYLGSTTIAYGPADSNEYADVICRLFLAEVLKGRSTGDALLTARLTYAKTAKPIDPVDLKTLGQFVLLGDPSAHPVVAAKASPKTKPKSSGMKALASITAPAPARDDRRSRREASRALADVVEATAPIADQPSDVPADILALLKAHSEKAGVTQGATMSVGLRDSRSALASLDARSKGNRPTFRTHMLFGKATRAPSTVARKSAGKRSLDYPVIVVATEQDNKVTGVQTIYGKLEGASVRGHRRLAPRRRDIEECSASGRPAE